MAVGYTKCDYEKQNLTIRKGLNLLSNKADIFKTPWLLIVEYIAYSLIE